jgi:hypothetical protein
VLPLEEVYRALLDALVMCGFQIKESGGNEIKAVSEASLWSWGEDIVVRVTPRDEGVNVQVSSSSKSQLFDWGKNQDNVRQVFRNLERLVSKGKGG